MRRKKFNFVLVVGDKKYGINISPTTDIEKLEKINKVIRTSLKRVYKIDLIDLIVNDLNLELEKCRICNIEYPPIYGIFDIDRNNKTITLKSFVYKKDIYCYGSNIDCDGRKLNPNSVEYIAKVNNLNDIDAMKFLKSRNKSPFYVESWENKEEYKKYQTRDEEFFSKYGKISYDDFVIKHQKITTLAGYIEKYGEEEGTRIFKEISKTKDSMSMDFCIKTCNGDKELAIHLYNERKRSVNVSLESLIAKHGLEKAHKINDNRSAILKFTTSINYFIEKYGEEEGTRKYKSRFENSFGGSVSKESVIFFDKIVDYLINVIKIEEADIMYKYKNEKKLIHENGSFFYDFTIESHKIIIEYNGVKFHPNKNKLSEEEWNTWKPIRGDKSADYLYERQERKINLAIENGYKIMEIWSDDLYQTNYDKCINFIINNLNINK